MRVSRAQERVHEAHGAYEGASAAALTVALLAEPRAVADLRRTVRCHLVHRGLAPYADTAQLCVSELMTNVINHVGAGVPVTLRVTMAYDRLRIELTDPAPHMLPTLVRPSDDQESGRGLALLDVFADRWGVVEDAESKTTWCELRTAPESLPVGGDLGNGLLL
ncbi:ATP-binding protein [Streptomyces armeniacus]|uniref:ATP-binding protein n=1 Tax=Streptomyces armeniacus TaxID=83291 RepID=A0A345XTX6_9ACTN|nr:ATP-binding protein [Streptomyces armeniacus]AXK35092.1 ATP-binding protein [Streptomyces armeniacus]